MDSGDIFGPEDFVPDFQPADRWQAIDELIAHLIARGRIKAEDRDKITTAVKQREMAMSTGIGFGLAIPHATTDLVTKAIGAVGRSKQGIDFDARDKLPVKTVVLFLVPKNFQAHLQSLAKIAKVLHKGDFR
jgi:mannitol/fructose-specific phosphotransferase system IIA component (Ntr-type)